MRFLKSPCPSWPITSESLGCVPGITIFFFNIYLFILAAPGLSCSTWIFSCDMQTLSCGRHVGPSSPTRDRTQAPCIGSVASYPLDHQGSPQASVFFFKLINLFLYLFLAALGLSFCARAFSSCSKWGLLFIAVRGLLTIVASLVVEHRLQTRRLSSCGSRA